MSMEPVDQYMRKGEVIHFGLAEAKRIAEWRMRQVEEAQRIAKFTKREDYGRFKPHLIKKGGLWMASSLSRLNVGRGLDPKMAIRDLWLSKVMCVDIA